MPVELESEVFLSYQNDAGKPGTTGPNSDCGWIYPVNYISTFVPFGRGNRIWEYLIIDEMDCPCNKSCEYPTQNGLGVKRGSELKAEIYIVIFGNMFSPVI
jgi:hypothetical protein